MNKAFAQFLGHNAMDYHSMELMLRGEYVSLSDNVAAKYRSRSSIPLSSSRTYDVNTSVAYINHLDGQLNNEGYKHG